MGYRSLTSIAAGSVFPDRLVDGSRPEPDRRPAGSDQ